MAPKITSSSNRSNRKARRPVTSDKGRGNRSSVSKAEVTQGSRAGGNGSGSGATMVTESLPRSRNPPRGTVTQGRGGTTTPQPTKPATPNSSAPVRPSIGNVSGPASRSRSQPKPPKPAAPKPTPTRPTLPAAGQSGGSKPPAGTTAPQRGGPTRTEAQKAFERRQAAAARRAGSGLGSRGGTTYISRPATRPKIRMGFGGLSIAQAVGYAIEDAIASTDTEWGASVRRGQWERVDTVNRAADYVFSGGRSNPQPADKPNTQPRSGGRQSPRGRSNSGYTKPPGKAADGVFAKATPSPSPTPSPRPSSGGGGGGGGGGRSSSPSPSSTRSAASSPTPSPSPTPKPEASKTGGGSYAGKKLYNADKKDNPLMKRTFGYQTGEGPKAQGGAKGPVSGVGPVDNGDKYAKKLEKRPASPSKSPVKGATNKTVLQRVAEMEKKRRQS